MTSFHIATLQIITPMPRYHITILLIGILLCTVSFVLALMLKRSNRNKDKLLTEMQETLNGLQNGLTIKENQINEEPVVNIFDVTLRAAELTTRLQRPRLSFQQNGYSPAVPERYGYIQSMAERGLSAKEIASMLSMSLHEATQLVTLTRVARSQQRVNNTVILT